MNLLQKEKHLIEFSNKFEVHFVFSRHSAPSLRDSFCSAVCIGASSFHHCFQADPEKLQLPGILLAICQLKIIQNSGILTVIYSKVNLNTTKQQQKKSHLR